MSSALLGLWKWHREFHCGVAAVAESVPIPASKCKLHLLHCNVLVLDISYRDDLRMFFAWRPDVVRSCAWVQWRQRFVVGTMFLDEADENVLQVCKLLGMVHVSLCGLVCQIPGLPTVTGKLTTFHSNHGSHGHPTV